MEVKKFEEPPAPVLGLNESNPVKGFVVAVAVVVSVGFISVEAELTGLFKNEKKFDAVVVVVVVEGVSFLSSFVIFEGEASF